MSTAHAKPRPRSRFRPADRVGLVLGTAGTACGVLASVLLASAIADETRDDGRRLLPTFTVPDIV